MKNMKKVLAALLALTMTVCMASCGETGGTAGNDGGTVQNSKTEDSVAEEKEDSKARFASGEARICIANQQSGAYGLNCFKKCDYTIYACSNNSVEQDYQSRHRFLRGQLDHPKFAYRLVVEGTVEERIYASLDLGTDLITPRNNKGTFELKDGVYAK